MSTSSSCSTADGVAAYSSQAPFGPARQFADVSVATRPDVRGRGLGHLVVAQLCDEIVARGLHPLYRRAVINTGSVRLCAALGFVPVIEVSGFRRRVTATSADRTLPRPGGSSVR